MKIDNNYSAFKAGEEDCQEEGVASHRARELAQNAEVVFEGVAEADEFGRVLCKRSVMSGRRPRTALFNSMIQTEASQDQPSTQVTWHMQQCSKQSAFVDSLLVR